MKELVLRYKAMTAEQRFKEPRHQKRMVLLVFVVMKYFPCFPYIHDSPQPLPLRGEAGRGLLATKLTAAAGSATVVITVLVLAPLA